MQNVSVMTKTVIHIAIILITSIITYSCNDNSNDSKSLKEIEIGEYSFQFPDDFKLIKENGLDSHVGKVSNGKIEFHFDYGYYSNSSANSKEEYVNKWIWKSNALSQLNYSIGSNINPYEEHKHVSLLRYSKIDSSHVRLILKYKSDTLKYDLELPYEVRLTQVEVDTTNGFVYKLVNSKSPKDKYVGLYAKNLNKFNKSINSYPALSITAYELAIKETEIALEILRSCKLIKK
jgi:hypothetical protein